MDEKDMDLNWSEPIMTRIADLREDGYFVDCEICLENGMNKIPTRLPRSLEGEAICGDTLYVSDLRVEGNDLVIRLSHGRICLATIDNIPNPNRKDGKAHVILTGKVDSDEKPAPGYLNGCLKNGYLKI